MPLQIQRFVALTVSLETELFACDPVIPRLTRLLSSNMWFAVSKALHISINMFRLDIHRRFPCDCGQ